MSGKRKRDRASANAGEIVQLAIPPRAGKQARADAIARSVDYGAHKYGRPVYSSVVEHMNASHVRFVENPDELEELGFETRSLSYDEARGLFVQPDEEREWWADPALGSPMFADPEYRFVDPEYRAPRRSKRMGFVGVGTLRLGARVLDRATVSDTHFKCCGYACVAGNRHGFKRWVRNELAPVVRFAHDSASEMAAAGDVLEAHMVELYHTTDIARRRELAMFIAETHAARADARRRTLVALLEVCTLDVALAWSRPTETPSEIARRTLEEHHARKWAVYPRSLVRMGRLTTASARVDHVSIGPGGGISVGYTVR